MVICGSEHGAYELYDFTGHQRGWEVLTRGYHNGPIDLPDYIAFCRRVGRDASDVAAAPPLKPPDREVPVVTTPTSTPCWSTRWWAIPPNWTGP